MDQAQARKYLLQAVTIVKNVAVEEETEVLDPVIVAAVFNGLASADLSTLLASPTIPHPTVKEIEEAAEEEAPEEATPEPFGVSFQLQEQKGKKLIALLLEYEDATPSRIKLPADAEEVGQLAELDNWQITIEKGPAPSEN